MIIPFLTSRASRLLGRETRDDYPRRVVTTQNEIEMICKMHTSDFNAPSEGKFMQPFQTCILSNHQSCEDQTQRMTKRKTKRIKLLPHEEELLQAGVLVDITHAGATARWLHAESGNAATLAVEDSNEDRDLVLLCYRHMGDREFACLQQSNQLPDTQPYQTLTRGQEGREYCEKYLRTNKYVNTVPTTVVEFACERALIERFWAIQCKIEDGTISHGLGNKAGNTLSEFNRALAEHRVQWRIVLVKRR